MPERDNLITLIQSAVGGCSSYWAGLIADNLIANDVVIPVRCKDCERCDTFYPRKEIGKEPIQVWYCKRYRCHREPDDFCSYGERKVE